MLEQNELLTNAIESLTHPFYVIDVYDYTIKIANSAANKCGLVSNATCYSVLHGCDTHCGCKEHTCPLEEIMRTMRSAVVEHLHYDTDNNLRNIEVHGYPIFDSRGDIIQMIVYSIDITDQKKAENQIKASLRENEILFGEINHRVKNNLQVLYGLLSIQAEYGKQKHNGDIFKESQNQIMSMSHVHEKIYQSKNLARINLNDYTKDLVEDLFMTCGVTDDYREEADQYVQLEMLLVSMLTTLNEVKINGVFQALLEHLCKVLNSFYGRMALFLESGEIVYDKDIVTCTSNFENKYDLRDKIIKIAKGRYPSNHIYFDFMNSKLIRTNVNPSATMISVYYFPLIYNDVVIGIVYFFNKPNYQFMAYEKFEMVRNMINIIIPLAHKLVNKVNVNHLNEIKLRDKYEFSEIVGHHPKLLEILEIVSQVADSDATILIQGECGTGKERIASAIHKNSKRNTKPFLPINCGAIPENLLESELFGHIRGAFTGAIKDKQGWFEKANGGTIFLDEVSKMSPALQIKLLRILQTGEYSRVGDSRIQYSDVRIVAATDRDLSELVKQGLFREDVYYRLNIIVIDIPPLRDRKSDILPLAFHFLNRFGKKYKKYGLELNLDTKLLLLAYDYPGNIRELENAIERATVFADGNLIKPYHLPACIQSEKHSYITKGKTSNFRIAKQKIIKDFEYNYINDCLKATKGNISLAATAAGIDLKNFYMKMKSCGINPRVFKIEKQ